MTSSGSVGASRAAVPRGRRATPRTLAAGQIGRSSSVSTKSAAISAVRRSSSRSVMCPSLRSGRCADFGDEGDDGCARRVDRMAAFDVNRARVRGEPRRGPAMRFESAPGESSAVTTSVGTRSSSNRALSVSSPPRSSARRAGPLAAKIVRHSDGSSSQAPKHRAHDGLADPVRLGLLRRSREATRTTRRSRRPARAARLRAARSRAPTPDARRARSSAIVPP